MGSVFEAKLWGMFEGLIIAWNSGFRKVVVKTDSLSTVQLLTNDTSPNHPLFSLIQSCKRVVADDWSCIVQHMYKGGNMHIDGLAHMGHNMKIGLLFFEDPPLEIRAIFIQILEAWLALDSVLPHFFFLVRFLGFCPPLNLKKKKEKSK
ncbi:hypothetical protein Dsin_000679 [Dipteronia sinensis]|uniref:RNase H type-1 domain-containing protein n=1 Tax=Dipteronia sinensis TaxID=43782 RepID=A0AAE0B3A8_9ROSI|nr:hypothetical protein Dsin_000679 [Dipteronia sinensis]